MITKSTKNEDKQCEQTFRSFTPFLSRELNMSHCIIMKLAVLDFFIDCDIFIYMLVKWSTSSNFCHDFR